MITPKQRIVILGGPGGGSVVAEAILQTAAAGSAVSVFGFLNDGYKRNEQIYGFQGRLG
jgi:hypothetical protein